ncbi:MAG: DUF924 family protein [Gammaproteobacteria bacterium]
MSADKVLEFWLRQTPPEKWYAQDHQLDAQIKGRFETAWHDLMAGRLDDWLTHAESTLAYVILADQFPRNMFRNQAKGFSSDALALAAAKNAINNDWDLLTEEPGRQFFYLPLMHSENLADQDTCCRLIRERIHQKDSTNLVHAQAHREIIRLLGRFPERNQALVRPSTQKEKEHIQQGGYAAVLQQQMAAPE